EGGTHEVEMENTQTRTFRRVCNRGWTTWNSQKPVKGNYRRSQKRGQGLLYTALTIHEIDEIAGPFVKKYPFLKVESFRGNALQLLQKITMEARSGRQQVDVAQFNGFEAWQLQKLGLLQSYKSPEARNFLDSYKDPAG